jgi:hypothetical protein
MGEYAENFDFDAKIAMMIGGSSDADSDSDSE